MTPSARLPGSPDRAEPLFLDTLQRTGEFIVEGPARFRVTRVEHHPRDAITAVVVVEREG